MLIQFILLVIIVTPCVLVSSNETKGKRNDTVPLKGLPKQMDLSYVVDDVLRRAMSKMEDTYQLTTFVETMELYNGVSDGWKNFHRDGSVITVPEQIGENAVLAKLKFRNITISYMMGEIRDLLGNHIAALIKSRKLSDAVELYCTVENVTVLMMLESRPRGVYPPFDLVLFKTLRIGSLNIKIKGGDSAKFDEWAVALSPPLIETAIKINIHRDIRYVIEEAVEDIIVRE